MNANPYESGTVSTSAPKTRATRWMILAGAVVLTLAVLCLLATVVGMTWSFNTIADASSTPDPSDLADGISTALIPSIAAIPLAIAGIVLLILGFVRREPVSSA